jgi:uncharacterized protein (DUF433 family)
MPQFDLDKQESTDRQAARPLFWITGPRGHERSASTGWSTAAKPDRLADWFEGRKLPRAKVARLDEWMVKRLRCARQMLGDTVHVDPDTLGGVMVIQGTRFPVARVFAEIADNLRLSEIAEDFDLDGEVLRTLIEGIAICFDRPIAE